jgi:hypothetical protein
VGNEWPEIIMSLTVPLGFGAKFISTEDNNYYGRNTENAITWLM